MLHRIFLFLLFLLVATDSYIYLRFVQKRCWSRWLKSLYWLPSVVLALGLMLLTLNDDFTPRSNQLVGIYLLVYMAVTIPKGLFTIISLLALLLRWCGKKVERAVNWLALAVSLAVMYMVVYGSTAGWRHFAVKEVPFASSDLPKEFDGYRVLQISDLHIGTIAGYPDVVRKMVRLVNDQRPDLIVFTGDLVNHIATELDSVQTILAGLQAPDGVYSVLGNHDYSLYYHWATEEAQAANLEDLKQREASMGWHLLNNDHVILQRDSAAIALIGVENDGEPPFPSKGDLPRAMQGTDGLFKILLSHDPTHWRREVLPHSDIQLMLAGHTHAMQFQLFGFTPASWFYRENQGLYAEGGRALYVNAGTGEVMLPFRFGAWPEITLFTLHKN